jgi:flagellum-specific peptidoglycan hydrolase FlgJ
MRKNKGLLMLILIGLLLQSATFSQSKYVKKYRPIADSLSMIYGIPSEVILGVAIIESSSGTSKNCKLLNNHFGITGKNNLWETKKIKTRYKQYPTNEASYADFCKLVSKRKFYPKLKGNPKYQKWIDAISKTGYSEQPEVWKKRVNDAIINNKL